MGKFMDFYRKLSIPYNAVLAGWVALGVFGFYVHGAFYEWPFNLVAHIKDIPWKAFVTLTTMGFVWLKGFDWIVIRSRFMREWYKVHEGGDLV